MLLHWFHPCPALTFSSTSAEHLIKLLWKGRPKLSQVETTAQDPMGQNHQGQMFVFLKSQKSSRTKQLGAKYNYFYKPNCYAPDNPFLKFPTSLFKIKLCAISLVLFCFVFFLLTQGHKTQISHCLILLWIYIWTWFKKKKLKFVDTHMDLLLYSCILLKVSAWYFHCIWNEEY